jgi:hypothetical protein
MAWFEDRFEAPTLDEDTWLPHYLPAWSSRAASAATYAVGDGLRLTVPVDAPLWCPDTHPTPLRVSGVQSGSWAGQQRFRPDQVVVSPEPPFDGWLPSCADGPARVEVTARMTLSPRSMAALWMSGYEDDPEALECGELCVFEVFGRSLTPTSAEVGVGIKAFRDPALREDFSAPRVAIDVTEPHTYACDWTRDEAVFTVDEQVVRRCARPPAYRLQLMIAVFDFPDDSTGDDADLVPELVVERVAGTR